MSEHPPRWPSSATVALQRVRLDQLRRRSADEIARIVQAIRRARTLPRLAYHVKRHARKMGLGSVEAYVAALQHHGARRDLRLFTYLRTSDRLPFWELVAPDGATVLYSQERRQVWSFFRPDDPDARMAKAEAWWIEVVAQAHGWRFEEYWRWKR